MQAWYICYICIKMHLNFKLGYANAMSVFLFVIVGALTHFTIQNI